MNRSLTPGADDDLGCQYFGDPPTGTALRGGAQDEGDFTAQITHENPPPVGHREHGLGSSEPGSKLRACGSTITGPHAILSANLLSSL